MTDPDTTTTCWQMALARLAAYACGALLLTGCITPAARDATPIGPAPTVTAATPGPAAAIAPPAGRPPRQGRRRLAQPRSSTPDALLNRFRAARFGDVQASGTVATASGGQVHFTLRDAPAVQFPGWADSNSPAFWDGDELVVFNSAFTPVRSSGSNLEDLRLDEPVQCLDCQRGGGRWMEAIWRDPGSGLLYGWYHLEPDDLQCLTAPVIGAAVSDDGGRTWSDRGPVLENGYPILCDYQNGYFVGGNGDFTVVVDQQRYFYFLFSNYGGPTEEQGIAVARGAFEGRGQPGTVFKYHQGGWNEPGLRGKVTPVFATPTGWAGPRVDAFWGPSAHWNVNIGKYVVVMNRTVGEEWEQEGVYLAVSDDLVNWGPPQKLMSTDQWYPQVFGLGPRGTDSLAGGVARLFVGGISKYVLQFER